ncbi:MAG TPA: Ig-like domain-containing protein [bacterium]
MGGFRRALAAVVGGVCLLAASPDRAAAFKLDTHVWVAQQVIDDLAADGMVTIEPFGTFPVNPELRDAILANRAAYRMGSVGPDGYPDMIASQLTVHPGVINANGSASHSAHQLPPTDHGPVAGAWRTDEWLAHLLRKAQTPQEKAFVYGFFSHAAADVFSHTYVNLYTGDYFDYTDGEVQNELRHMAVEGYIKNHTPPVVTSPADAAAPLPFVRDALIFDPDAAAQYAKIPFLVHLVGMRGLVGDVDQAQAYLQGVEDDLAANTAAVQEHIDALDAWVNGLRIDVFGTSIPLYPGYCFVDPGTCLTYETTRYTLEATLAANRLAIESIIAPNKAVLWAYRRNVMDAIDDYVAMSQEMSLDLLLGDPNRPSPLSRLGTWTCTAIQQFAAVPQVVSDMGCVATSPTATLTDLLGATESAHSQLLDDVTAIVSNLEWLVNPMVAFNAFQGYLSDAVSTKANELANQLASEAGPESLLYKMVDARTRTYTPALLNEVYATDAVYFDGTPKDLLIFNPASNPIAPKIDVDMGLAAPDTGYFNPVTFAPAYDSVVFSKLALLDASALNTLARRAGVADTIYGKNLYNPQTFQNVLIGAVPSIDGDHQWEEVAPRRPRRTGADTTSDLDRTFGYKYDTANGLRFWQDCQARELVFKRIFRGPLAPGIMSSLPAGDENIEPTGDPALAFPLSLYSDLPLKVTLADGSTTFDATTYQSSGGSLNTLWAAKVTPLQSLVIPTANKRIDVFAQIWYDMQQHTPDAYVFDLSNQVCGGQDGQQVTTTWAFSLPDLAYSCSFVEVPVTIRGITTYRHYLRCSDPAGLSQPINPATNFYGRGFTTADWATTGISHSGIPKTVANATEATRCTACHALDAYYNVTLKNSVGIGVNFLYTGHARPKAVGKGSEYNGMLICDTSAGATNLVLRAPHGTAVNPAETRAGIDVTVTVRNPVSGEARTSAAKAYADTTTNLYNQQTYTSWTVVNDMITSGSGGARTACTNTNLLDAAYFPTDTTAPRITAPPDRALDCAAVKRVASATLLGTPTVSDDRDPAPVVTNNAPASFDLGNASVVWTARDAAGNQATASQAVHVTDAAAPVLPASLPPVNVVLGTTPVLTPPVAADACDGNVTASTGASVAGLPLGDTTITWTATDRAGNVARVTQALHVFTPNQPPAAVDDAASTLKDHAVSVPVLGNDHDPEGDPIQIYQVRSSAQGVTPVASGPGVSYTPKPGFVGTDTFTYVIADGLHLAPATVTITVVENRPPAARAGGPYAAQPFEGAALDGSGSSDPDAGDAVASWEWDLDNDGVFDDASGATVSLSWEQVQALVCGGACAIDSPHTVELRVTDTRGASGTEATTLTVGNLPPVAAPGGPYCAMPGRGLTLDGSASADADAALGDGIASYAWDLDGDLFFDDAAGPLVPLSWAALQAGVCGGSCAAGGAYPATLAVTDLGGRGDTGAAAVLFPQRIFLEPFTHGTAAGDRHWQEVSGGWVAALGRLASSPGLVNVALLQGAPALPADRALRFAFRAQLTGAAAAGANAGFVFAWRNATNFRYVKLVKGPGLTGLVIGQVGDPARRGERSGVRAKVPLPLRTGVWYPIEVLLRPDGRVEVFRGSAAAPALRHAFPTAYPGRVGLAADRAVSYFDDFAVWRYPAPAAATTP